MVQGPSLGNICGARRFRFNEAYDEFRLWPIRTEAGRDQDSIQCCEWGLLGRARKCDHRTTRAPTSRPPESLPPQSWLTLLSISTSPPRQLSKNRPQTRGKHKHAHVNDCKVLAGVHEEMRTPAHAQDGTEGRGGGHLQSLQQSLQRVKPHCHGGGHLEMHSRTGERQAWCA